MRVRVLLDHRRCLEAIRVEGAVHQCERRPGHRDGIHVTDQHRLIWTGTVGRRWRDGRWDVIDVELIGVDAI